MYKNFAAPEIIDIFTLMIQCHDIHKRFANVEILRGIDLTISSGEIVSIVGPSGAGKTTLLQILGTLMPADSGIVEIDSLNINTLSGNKLSELRNQKIGFIFQFHHLLPEFTALENVMIPALIAKHSPAAARAQAIELLRIVGLTSRSTHKPSALSGGEQQRVAAARALINKPSIILADEPSGNLDSVNRNELHSLFFDLRQQTGQTFLIVTHDNELATQSDRTITMTDGLICK